MSDHYSMAENAICLAAEQIKIAFVDVANLMSTPAILYRPRLFMDGNLWCALYGENIQEGVSGFGDSPAQAMEQFNMAWYRKMTK